MTEGMRRKVIGFWGATGSGKTQAARARLKDRKEFPRVIYFDPMRDYYAGVDVERTVGTREELLTYLDDMGPVEPFSVAYQPTLNDLPPHAVAFLSKVAWAMQNMTLVVDEAHSALHANMGPEEFLLLVRQGRHRRINLFVITPRPTEVAPSIRSEIYACESYIFHLARMDDLQDLASVRGQQFAGMVARLPDLTGFHLVKDMHSIVKVILPQGGRKLPSLLEGDFQQLPGPFVGNA